MSSVEHPTHYNSGRMETWDWMALGMTQEEFRGFLLGNVLKYLSRYKHKGKPQEDLEKAQNYLGRLILMEKNDVPTPEG